MKCFSIIAFNHSFYKQEETFRRKIIKYKNKQYKIIFFYLSKLNRCYNSTLACWCCLYLFVLLSRTIITSYLPLFDSLFFIHSLISGSMNLFPNTSSIKRQLLSSYEILCMYFDPFSNTIHLYLKYWYSYQDRYTFWFVFVPPDHLHWTC